MRTTVRLSKPHAEIIDLLMKRGLYGETREEVVHYLLATQIMALMGNGTIKGYFDSLDALRARR